MGKMSRDKGARVEREIVNCHKEAGVHAERYDARRGQFGAERSYDIDVYWQGKDKAPLCGEIKARKKFPDWLTGYLADNDFLVLRENGRQPLYVVPHEVWIRVLKNEQT
jgi:Holliday junction resolvase